MLIEKIKEMGDNLKLLEGTDRLQYLVDKAIQLGYETKPDMIAMAPYFEKKFEKGIKEGKSFANRGRISGRRRIVQHSF